MYNFLSAIRELTSVLLGIILKNAKLAIIKNSLHYLMDYLHYCYITCYNICLHYKFTLFIIIFITFFICIIAYGF